MTKIRTNELQSALFFLAVHPRCVLRSHVLGYGKCRSQTQLNFINIKCHIND